MQPWHCGTLATTFIVLENELLNSLERSLKYEENNDNNGSLTPNY